MIIRNNKDLMNEFEEVDLDDLSTHLSVQCTDSSIPVYDQLVIVENETMAFFESSLQKKIAAILQSHQLYSATSISLVISKITCIL